ncbi:DUF6502 family protein [Roseomonas sp. E05]|uniref:DUF6502 family protein n=1 Tax=Roseomonas sp. E05 TaxID=3046310 RepID=UPI0024B895C4|nr:DUF6502 family protein [Roseomonas sp. E05]MDJ0390593.1 DUF6502 family protein [Roseomonas sp. E05]
MHDLSQPPAPQGLLRPVARLLRPLVWLLIRSGVTFPILAELLRTLYVQLAAEFLEREGVRSDSRISLLTGVHRKEIRRLREQGETRTEVPAVVTVTSQAIARWVGLPQYTDASGQPRPLPRTAPAGIPSFEALVASVTTDVRPRAVLDDWLSQGLVLLDAEGQVVLKQAAFLPRPGSEEQLYYFTRNLRDHLAAASANIANPQPPYLERGLHYDRLPPELAARLEAQWRAAAQQMLIELNRQALASLEASGEAPPGSQTRRVHLGVYLYAEDEPPAAGAP